MSLLPPVGGNPKRRTFIVVRPDRDPYADLVDADEIQVGPGGVAVMILDDEIVAVYGPGTFSTITPATPLVLERMSRPRPAIDPSGKRPRLFVTHGPDPEGYMGDLDAGARLELIVDGNVALSWGLEDLPQDGASLELELTRKDTTDAELEELRES